MISMIRQAILFVPLSIYYERFLIFYTLSLVRVCLISDATIFIATTAITTTLALV